MSAIQETREAIAKSHVTAIEGQITAEDMSKLRLKLCKIAGSIPTSIGGDTLRHLIDSRKHRISNNIDRKCNIH